MPIADSLHNQVHVYFLPISFTFDTMKRIVLAGVIALGLLVVQTSFAQVQVGIRGGANWGFASKPEILGGLTSALRPSVGPTGAIFLDIPLSDYVSFRPEVAYVQKGVMVREGVTFNAFNIPITLGGRVAYQSQNIEVPLLFKFNLTSGPVQPYVIVGPAVNYAVDGRVRTRGTGFLSTKPLDVDVNYGGMLSRWDVSAVGGLGLVNCSLKGATHKALHVRFKFLSQM